MERKLIKVFVTWEKAPTTRIELEINRDEPIHTALSNACSRLNAGDYFNFVFQIENTKQYIEEGDLLRPEFQFPAGSILIMKRKPSIIATEILQQLQDHNPATKKKAVFELKKNSPLLRDVLFLREFVSTQNGLDLLIGFISESSGNTLSLGLYVLGEIFSQGIIPDKLSLDFIQKLMSFLDQNINICRSTLPILVSICASPKFGFKTLSPYFSAQNPPYSTLVKLLGNEDLRIQLNALNLVNELLSKSENEYSNLCSILDSLNINSYLKKSCNLADAEHQVSLFYYQRFRLKAQKIKKETLFTKGNQEDEAKLVRLWQATFPETPLDNRISEKWKEMGFQGTDPATDFRGMGLLGLDNLVYFAETYPDQWRKMIAVQNERSGKDYPVAVAGINVTSVLYELFISKPETSSEGEKIFNVLFDHSHAFDEIYCTAFKILDEMWIEMDASYMDFPKVIAAMKARLNEAIVANPSSLEQFNRAATWRGVKPQVITNKSTESTISEVEDVKQLRARIREETTRLVKEQKVAYLADGNWFKEPKSKGKSSTLLYCRLSENHKELLYGSAPEFRVLPTETTTVKISDFSDCLVGLNSPLFAKAKGKKPTSPQEEEAASLTFSLVNQDQSKCLDFVALTREDFANWTDGFRALLYDKVENKETVEEINQLETIQLRVHLLDLDGIEIPSTVPDIPMPVKHQ